MNKFSNLIAKAKNNPDYAAAILTGYVSMGLQIVIQILLVPLYLHTLGSYRFGALMILSAQIAFGYLFVGFFYSVLLRRFRESLTAGDTAEFTRVYVAGKMILLAIGALFGFMVLGLEAWYPVFFEDVPTDLQSEIWWATALAVLHFFLMCEVSVEQTLFSALQRQVSGNLLGLIGLVAFAVAVVPWLLSGGGLAGVFGCFVLGDVLSRIYAFITLRRAKLAIQLSALATGFGETCRHLLSGRATFYFAYALVAMVLQSDVLIIGMLSGADVTAQFVLVWKIADVMVLVISRITIHLQPEFLGMDVAGDRARLRRVYHEAYWGLLLVSAVIAAGYALVGPWIMQLWVGAERAPKDPWLYWLAGAAILWLGASRLPGILAQALSRMRGLLCIATIEMTAKLGLIVALFPIVNIRASLIAISAVHGLGIAVAYWWLGRHLIADDGTESPAKKRLSEGHIR